MTVMMFHIDLSYHFWDTDLSEILYYKLATFCFYFISYFSAQIFSIHYYAKIIIFRSEHGDLGLLKHDVHKTIFLTNYWTISLFLDKQKVAFWDVIILGSLPIAESTKYFLSYIALIYFVFYRAA